MKRGLYIEGLVLMALGLSQCQKPEKGSPETTFQIDVNFTPDVLRDMQAAGDKVTVDIYYYGLAAPDHKAEADLQGRVRLGEDLVDIKPRNQSFTVTGSGIDRTLLSHVIDRTPYAMISAYSTRTDGTMTNRITCDYFIGRIRDAQTHPAKVSCAHYEP